MTSDPLHPIERAAFDAWPALHETQHSGWLLRFAHGYTKRANSANAIATISSLGEPEISAVESFYRDRGLPAIFRLASFCTSQAVDDALADRRYRFADMSLVMTRPLTPATQAAHLGPGAVPQRPHPPAFETPPESLTDIDAWLADYQSITGAIEDAPPAHRQLLRAIRGETRFLVSRTGGRAVCCGLGVISHRHLGLFQIATHPGSRGHGLASALCAALLRWGASRGADSAYLQVEAANLPAVRIYEMLGFRRRYHYWYRIG